MKITSAEFITSAVKAEQYPKKILPQIAFAGRSNVGKSSLINHLLTRKALAKVSKTPGKTRTINFFLINKKFYFVDLPGYGFAKVSPEEQEKWEKMIEDYLLYSENLKQIMILTDIRHQLSDLDIQMLQWAEHFKRPFSIIATKSDQLSKSRVTKAVNDIEQIIAEVLPYSSARSIHPHSIKSGAAKAQLWKLLNGFLR